MGMASLLFDIILSPNIGEVINHEFTELLGSFR